MALQTSRGLKHFVCRRSLILHTPVHRKYLLEMRTQHVPIFLSRADFSFSSNEIILIMINPCANLKYSQNNAIHVYQLFYAAFTFSSLHKSEFNVIVNAHHGKLVCLALDSDERESFAEKDARYHLILKTTPCPLFIYKDDVINSAIIFIAYPRNH